MLPTTPATSKTLQPATVFAALGPNPAPLAELLWALHRQRGLRPTALFLVVDSRGHHFLQRELLGPGAVLHELALLLDLTLPPDAIHLRVVTGPGGAVLDDDDPGHADLYNAAIWDMARAATLQAGDDVVVFALTAGRRRTMTAMSTMAFQLLARAWDLCLDVRVSDKRAEGGVGFYFPEQQQRDIVAKNRDLADARDVAVVLAEVLLPRLSGLLSTTNLSSYAAALQASQSAIDDAAMPTVVVDLVAGKLRVNGVDVGLTGAQLIWYATLAEARQRGDGWLMVTNVEALQAMAVRCEPRSSWVTAVKHQTIDAFVGGETPDHSKRRLANNLSKLRTDTANRIESWCRANHPKWSRFLVPEKDSRLVNGDRRHRQRISIDGRSIVISGL